MKRKKCQETHREELFYYVTSGSNMTRDVHWCVTVDYQQIENNNIANQIYRLIIDYGKFILNSHHFKHSYLLYLICIYKLQNWKIFLSTLSDCSPRDQSLSNLLYSKTKQNKSKVWKTHWDSSNNIRPPLSMCNSSQHFAGNSELFPICCHSFRNVAHSVSLLDVMWPWTSQRMGALKWEEQGSTLTAARLPGATKNFIGATKFQILVARSGSWKFLWQL